MHERILILENEPVVLDFARLVLEKRGHEVLAARSIAEARELLNAQPPAEALCLVIDVVLDEENGIAFAKEALRFDPAARVLFVSGFTDDVLLGDPEVSGRIAFLRKPFTPNELVAAVDSVCAS